MGHTFGTIKWRLLVNTKSSYLPFLIALRCHFAGLFANLFLPSLAGGDVVRAGLAIRYLKQKGNVILGGILDRFLDTSALGIIILIGAYFAPQAFTDTDRNILRVVFVILSLMALSGGIFLLLPTFTWLPSSLKKLLKRYQELVKELLKTPWKAIISLLVAIIMQTTFVGINAYLGMQCGIDIPFVVWILVWPLAKLSALLPISMGGLGVREAALAALLTRLDIPIALAVGVGLLWETILVSGGILGGIFYLVMNQVDTPFPSLSTLRGTPKEL